MPLHSNLLSGNPRLQGCLVNDSDHVTPGSRGYHVRLIQAALEALDGSGIAEQEMDEEHYGPTTTAAVLGFKQARSIINPSYQTSADSIVGKMTIARLDQEMRDLEMRPPPPRPIKPIVPAAKGSKETQAKNWIASEMAAARIAAVAQPAPVGQPAFRPISPAFAAMPPRNFRT